VDSLENGGDRDSKGKEEVPVAVVPFDASRKDAWSAFLRESNNGTVFHSLEFLDYHPPGRFPFLHLMFYSGEALLAVLPGGVADGVFRSPMGASFGGIVTRPGISLAQADGVVKALLRYAADTGVREIRLVPPMQIYSHTFDETVEYALLYNGFQPLPGLFSSVIDLRRVKGKADLSKNTRHKVNKALNKGVTVREGLDLDSFYPILLENKAKFGVAPTHTLEELHRIERLLPGMMTLFLAYVDGRPVAGELLFAANPACVLNFYTMHRYEYRNHFPVNLLVEHALGWCAGKGFAYYDYGVSQDTFHSDPMEPSWPLIRFKESMEATGCIRKAFGRNV
jgi:hypothetical protein